MRDRQAFRSNQRLSPPAQTLDRRAHLRLARKMSKARKGLGMPQSQEPRFPPPRLYSPHAAKALQPHNVLGRTLSGLRRTIRFLPTRARAELGAGARRLE